MHVAPVPPGTEDCAATGGHFNPTWASSTCVEGAPCEAGDLSGKWGRLNATNLTVVGNRLTPFSTHAEDLTALRVVMTLRGARDEEWYWTILHPSAS